MTVAYFTLQILTSLSTSRLLIRKQCNHSQATCCAQSWHFSMKHKTNTKHSLFWKRYHATDESVLYLIVLNASLSANKYIHQSVIIQASKKKNHYIPMYKSYADSHIFTRIPNPECQRSENIRFLNFPLSHVVIFSMLLWISLCSIYCFQENIEKQKREENGNNSNSEYCCLMRLKNTNKNFLQAIFKTNKRKVFFFTCQNTVSIELTNTRVL